MDGSTVDQLAAELGGTIVAQVAPQELPLYRTISQAYLLSPNEIHSKPRNKDEMLGFGIPEAVTYLTPAILPILSTVIKFLAEEIKDSIHHQHLVGNIHESPLRRDLQLTFISDVFAMLVNSGAFLAILVRLVVFRRRTSGAIPAR